MKGITDVALYRIPWQWHFAQSRRHYLNDARRFCVLAASCEPAPKHTWFPEFVVAEGNVRGAEKNPYLFIVFGWLKYSHRRQ
ncbi:MAG: hypothetical protein JNM43_23480 [Planctomycetaceae bacterium]|nr:hypothetical protein [Planctomycetaceae bacterium]